MFKDLVMSYLINEPNIHVIYHYIIYLFKDIFDIESNTVRALYLIVRVPDFFLFMWEIVWQVTLSIIWLIWYSIIIYGPYITSYIVRCRQDILINIFFYLYRHKVFKYLFFVFINIVIISIFHYLGPYSTIIMLEGPNEKNPIVVLSNHTLDDGNLGHDRGVIASLRLQILYNRMYPKGTEMNLYQAREWYYVDQRAGIRSGLLDRMAIYLEYHRDYKVVRLDSPENIIRSCKRIVLRNDPTNSPIHATEELITALIRSAPASARWLGSPDYMPQRRV